MPEEKLQRSHERLRARVGRLEGQRDCPLVKTVQRVAEREDHGKLRRWPLAGEGQEGWNVSINSEVLVLSWRHHLKLRGSVVA